MQRLADVRKVAEAAQAQSGSESASVAARSGSVKRASSAPPGSPNASVVKAQRASEKIGKGKILVETPVPGFELANVPMVDGAVGE